MSFGYVSRRETFSAAHRLHSPHLSDEENKLIYGPCNHPHGHGHNYDIEVIVRGRIDPKTGMIVNLAKLKLLVKQRVLSEVDHQFLDVDVAFFREHPSTAENVAVFVWNQLVDWIKTLKEVTMEEDPVLYEVRVTETQHNVAIYRGE